MVGVDSKESQDAVASDSVEAEGNDAASSALPGASQELPTEFDPTDNSTGEKESLNDLTGVNDIEDGNIDANVSGGDATEEVGTSGGNDGTEDTNGGQGSAEGGNISGESPSGGESESDREGEDTIGNGSINEDTPDGAADVEGDSTQSDLVDGDGIGIGDKDEEVPGDELDTGGEEESPSGGESTIGDGSINEDTSDGAADVEGDSTQSELVDGDGIGIGDEDEEVPGDELDTDGEEESPSGGESTIGDGSINEDTSDGAADVEGDSTQSELVDGDGIGIGDEDEEVPGDELDTDGEEESPSGGELESAAEDAGDTGIDENDNGNTIAPDDSDAAKELSDDETLAIDLDSDSNTHDEVDIVLSDDGSGIAGECLPRYVCFQYILVMNMCVC